MLFRGLYAPAVRTILRPSPFQYCSRLSSMASSRPLTAAVPSNEYQPRYVDIGINLADKIFQGISGGKQRHPNDLDAVISRAKEVGCSKLMITGSDFQSIKEGLKVATDYPTNVFVTAGIHPCNSAIFAASPLPEKPLLEDGTPNWEHPVDESIDTSSEKSKSVVEELMKIVQDDRASSTPQLVAMGEFGLDYDRLHYCSKRLQLASFRAQLQAVASMSPQLPLFLHSRACHEDFVTCMKEAFGDNLEKLEKGGVVHSFTGTLEEMKELMDLGLYIGVNGCSLKTEENCSVVNEIRLDRLMLETDGPWCEVRPSHEGWKYLIEKQEPTPEATTPNGDASNSPAQPCQQPRQKQQQKPKKGPKTPEVPSRFKVVKKEKWEEGAMVKGRNEPCMIERVAKIVAGIKGVSVEEVCEAAWSNTIKVFDLGERKK